MKAFMSLITASVILTGYVIWVFVQVGLSQFEMVKIVSIYVAYSFLLISFFWNEVFKKK